MLMRWVVRVGFLQSSGSQPEEETLPGRVRVGKPTVVPRVGTVQQYRYRGCSSSPDRRCLLFVLFRNHAGRGGGGGGILTVEDGRYVADGGAVLFACGQGKSMYDVKGCLSSWVLLGDRGGRPGDVSEKLAAASGGESQVRVVAASVDGRVFRPRGMRVPPPPLLPSLVPRCRVTGGKSGLSDTSGGCIMSQSRRPPTFSAAYGSTYSSLRERCNCQT